MTSVKVVAGIIVKESKILLTRRGPEQSLAGFWEFPGGKMEGGESPEDCLKRELYEELGIDAKVGAFVASNIHQYPAVEVDLHAYWVEFNFLDFALVVHDRAEWVEVEQLVYYELSPADIPIAEVVCEQVVGGLLNRR